MFVDSLLGNIELIARWQMANLSIIRFGMSWKIWFTGLLTYFSITGHRALPHDILSSYILY